MVGQSHFFKKIKRIKKIVKSHAGQVKRKVGWPEIPLETTLLGLPHIVKATSVTWPNPRVKLNSTLAESFSKSPALY